MFELAKTIFMKHIESLEEGSPLKAELETRLSETYQVPSIPKVTKSVFTNIWTFFILLLLINIVW
jgi:hypothetical protein